MTATIELPGELSTNIHNRWPGHGAAWVHGVMRQLHRLCARYEAEPLHLMPARFGLVVAVSSPRGPLIMKSTPDPAGPVQAAVARHFADLGMTPTVHEVVTTVTGTWTVMDRVCPGNTLETATLSAGHTDHLIALLHSMIGKAAPIEAPDVADWLQARLIDSGLGDVPPFQTCAPPAERLNTLEILHSLCNSFCLDLCHGDANLGNVLVGERDRLWWIDPRGVRGEVAHDVAVIALKAASALGTYPNDPAAALAGEVGVCPRACAWVSVAHSARVWMRTRSSS
jgi:streptomycin 6-kinase